MHRCQNCGFRTCVCNQGNVFNPKPTPVDDEEEETVDHLDYWMEELKRDWSKHNIYRLLEEVIGRIKQLEEEDPPNTHIITGPPRS